jgi:hypothetical protein
LPRRFALGRIKRNFHGLIVYTINSTVTRFSEIPGANP